MKKLIFIRITDKICIKNNDLYQISKSDVDNVYSLTYDSLLYERLVKISSILGEESLLCIELSEYLKHQISQSDYLTSLLSKELSDSINNEILNKLKKLGDNE